MSSDNAESAPRQPAAQPTALPPNARAVFRSSTVLLLVAFFVAVCATPFAWGATGLQAVYVVPVVIIVWTLRRRTTVDRDGMVVRTVWSKRVLPWAEIAGLRLTPKAQVYAVLRDEAEIRLPTVRTRHIPVIAILSEGRIPDTTVDSTEQQDAPTADAPEEVAPGEVASEEVAPEEVASEATADRAADVAPDTNSASTRETDTEAEAAEPAGQARE
ncbi:PH domain-containing protein [Tamaricihabitans halophyticus]|nr:PH domain-containing protein [Tamaricihabitans halophyticus]